MKFKDKEKTRRHHNNKGTRHIKLGKCRDDVVIIAKKLGIKYKYNERENEK